MIPSEEILSAYLDDELGPQERLDVEHRLASDAQYRETFEKLKEVRGWLQDLPPIVPSRPKSISQMLAEDVAPDTTAQVRLNANSDLTAGPQSWKWLTSLAATAAIVVGSTLWWFSASVDQLAQGPNTQSPNTQSPKTESPAFNAQQKATDSALEAEADLVGNDRAMLDKEPVASSRMPPGDASVASSPAILQDSQLSSPNPLARNRVGNTNSIPSATADVGLDNNMAGGFGGGLGSPAAGGNPAAGDGSNPFSKRANFPALGAAPGAPLGSAADAPPMTESEMKNGEIKDREGEKPPIEIAPSDPAASNLSADSGAMAGGGSAAERSPLEPSPVRIERLLTAIEHDADSPQYAVVQAPAVETEVTPEVGAEELHRKEEQTSQLAKSVIHLKVPAEVFSDIQESLDSGALKLQPAKSSSLDSPARQNEKKNDSDTKASDQTPANGVWLLEIFADDYESLRNHWSEKGFDISEILDDQKLQVVRLKPATDRSDESGAKNGNDRLLLLLLQPHSH
jgi:hypothetical protein